MEIDKILLILSESHRKAIASVIVCTLIFYPILFLYMPDFRNIEWYVQLLLTSGISVSYIGFYVCWVIFSFKDSDVFLLPIPIIACCAFGEIIFWEYSDNSSLLKFFIKVLGFSFISFALIYLSAYRNKRKEHNKSSEKPK